LTGADPARIPPAALAASLVGPVLDQKGQLRSPLRLVDLDDGGSPGAVDEAVRAATAADGVLVGVCTRGRPHPSLRTLVAALDLSLVPVSDEPAERELVPVADPWQSAVALAATAGEFPHAASVLAALLRWSGTLGIRDGLDAESLAYSTLLGGPEFRGWLERRGPRPLPPPAVGDPVRLHRADGDLHVTLNRPERRNAYGREVRDALVAALQLAELDATVDRVVLEGAGPSFCSGGDLDEFGTTPDLATAHLVRTHGGAALPLSRLADRVEARLHGVCVGAGIELPAFARRVVAAPETGFRLPEVGMGLIPGAGGTVSIPRRIGRWRTLWLALTGDVLDTPTALGWGLIDAIEEPGQVSSEGLTAVTARSGDAAAPSRARPRDQ
jgi:enoyl-CoA hydratase/carnithine racemase